MLKSFMAGSYASCSFWFWGILRGQAGWVPCQSRGHCILLAETMERQPMRTFCRCCKPGASTRTGFEHTCPRTNPNGVLPTRLDWLWWMDCTSLGALSPIEASKPCWHSGFVRSVLKRYSPPLSSTTTSRLTVTGIRKTLDQQSFWLEAILPEVVCGYGWETVTRWNFMTCLWMIPPWCLWMSWSTQPVCLMGTRHTKCYPSKVIALASWPIRWGVSWMLLTATDMALRLWVTTFRPTWLGSTAASFPLCSCVGRSREAADTLFICCVLTRKPCADSVARWKPCLGSDTYWLAHMWDKFWKQHLGNYLERILQV